MVAALCMYTSCLKSDSDGDVKYYDDTAITSFSLGTVNRYLHTKSKSGEDSVYKTTFAGSTYKFYIDQKTFEIYNPDSLPYGSDAAHLLCTITSKNSGVVVLKNIDSDTLKYFSTSDSLDFSVPRVLRVISNDGTATRDYTVRVNVRQESADKVVWTEKLMPTAMSVLLRSFVSMRLLAAGKQLVLLGSDGNTTQLMTSTDGGDWSLSNAVLGAGVADNAVALGDDVLMVDGAQLMCLKADGSLTPVEASMVPLRLLAASGSRLYGLGADGAMAVSADKGLTWTAETLDSDNALLPTQDVSSACWALRTNTDVEQLLLVGNRSLEADATGATAQVWCKIIDEGQTTDWNYITPASGVYLLPRLQGLKVVRYADAVLALGGKGFGGCSEAAFARFYASRDGGINWLQDSRFSLPANFSCAGVFGMTVDADNHLWIVSGSTGVVYSARLGSLKK